MAPVTKRAKPSSPGRGRQAPDLNQSEVTVQLPPAAAEVEPQPFLLKLAGHEAGVVFARKPEGATAKGLELRFRWADVVNPSVLPLLPAGKSVSVELVKLGSPRQRHALGGIQPKVLAGFVQPSPTTGADILVATSKKRQARALPATDPVVTADVTLVAFYLPQYHPVVENDIWWGAGFTEWTMVARAKPCFKGHQQPRLPGELGFYDLRVPEVLAAQAQLARAHGIGAFCFYYYWFGGRRLLEKPLELLLANPGIDMPFCICWANEPWTRRWDGNEQDVLLAQPHTPESDARFILDALPVLQDPRYLRVNGKPLLLVYRAALLELPEQTTAIWRQICREHGLGEIELAAVEAFGFGAPAEHGFDSTVEFPPHGGHLPAKTPKPLKGAPPYQGDVRRYTDAAAWFTANEHPWRRYRGVMPGWDNTPRKGNKSFAFVKATPERYAQWLDSAVADTRRRLGKGERLVFINAWNEWGEGAVLEPCQEHGRAYLEATRAVAQGALGWETRLQQLGAAETSEAQRASAIAYLAAQIDTYHRALDYMRSRLQGAEQAQGGYVGNFPVTAIWPQGLVEGMKMSKATGAIELLGSMGRSQDKPLQRRANVRVMGWLQDAANVPTAPALLHVMLVAQATRQTYFGSIYKRMHRPDLQAGNFAGFEGTLDFSQLPAGKYAMALLQKVKGNWCIARLPKLFVLV